jgi:transcriptional regulator with XRE-family HTH domain
MGEACGVAAQTVIRWELGTRSPRARAAERYATALSTLLVTLGDEDAGFRDLRDALESPITPAVTPAVAAHYSISVELRPSVNVEGHMPIAPIWIATAIQESDGKTITAQNGATAEEASRNAFETTMMFAREKQERAVLISVGLEIPSGIRS